MGDHACAISHLHMLRRTLTSRARYLSLPSIATSIHSLMSTHRKIFDPRIVAADVQALAASDTPIAPLVTEALDVIDQALDTHGWVCPFDLLSSLHPSHLYSR